MSAATERCSALSRPRYWATLLLGVLLLDPQLQPVLAQADPVFDPPSRPAATPDTATTSQPQVEIDVLLVQVQGRLGRQIDDYLRDHSKQAGSDQRKPAGLFSSLFGGDEGAVLSSGQFFTLNSPRNTKAFRAFVEGLEKQGRAKIMAEPRLVTISGRQASFLDGGQQSIPVIKESGQIGTEFEEYGTRLSCSATVLENGKIHLEVEPELSQLDSASGTTINGQVVPGRVTQRVRTTVEIEDGQTLVLGGMVQHQVNATEERVPVLAELPLVGAAFTNKTFKEVETELLFILTAHLIADNQSAGGDNNQSPTPAERKQTQPGKERLPRDVAARLEQAERQLKKLQKEINDLHRELHSR